jgi:iron complex outermembrane recepter protein
MNSQKVRRFAWGAIASLFVLCSFACAQVVVQGAVRSGDGQPVKGVTVAAPDLGLRTFTDDQGRFRLDLKGASGPVLLAFDAPGYYAESRTYSLAGAASTLDVELTPHTMVRQEINVVTSRLDVPFAVNPAATAVVVPQTFDTLPRGVATEEALGSVPGVKVDNQANGERVHVSIRGQGILSEHGLRGIQVLLDGIPLNDPSGFAPDLFDIDWNGVQELQVVRGPVGVLYGGGSAGGVIDIRTGQPTETTHGGFWSTGGSNGFYKGRADVSGITSGLAYSLAISRTAGDGYRDHSAFWGDNVSGRFGFAPASRLHLNAMLLGTGYFNQNPEGLSLEWLQQNRQQANPDSLTYNEYQKTRRFTFGLTGDWITAERQHLGFTFFTRRTKYDEPVPSSIDHRTLLSPGGSFQYHVESGSGFFKNYLSAGSDLDHQSIDERIDPNLGQCSGRQIPICALQNITQNRAAGYLMDRMGLGSKWTVFLSGRWDHIGNQLQDNLKLDGTNLSGDQTFQRGTARVGVSWTPRKDVTLYSSWGQGFLPPATEELESNPKQVGGFNMGLKPATSSGEEVGIRGSVGAHFSYDTAFFHLATKNDFERYRIPERPLETFYDNAGDTRRYGLEASVRWITLRRLTLSGAYTYSHFTYTKYDSLMYPGNQVGHFLPNAPAHQFYGDALMALPRHFSLGVNTQIFSHAFIDPINDVWIGTYGLLNARLSKGWQRKRYSGTYFVTARNLANRDYIAFTEPDYPDRHSYQPGPEREVFGGIEVRF